MLTQPRRLLYCCGERHRLLRGDPPPHGRAVIREQWIERAIASPIREYVQADAVSGAGPESPKWKIVSFGWFCWGLVRQCIVHFLTDGSRHENSLLFQHRYVVHRVSRCGGG